MVFTKIDEKKAASQPARTSGIVEMLLLRCISYRPLPQIHHGWGFGLCRSDTLHRFWVCFIVGFPFPAAIQTGGMPAC